MITKNRKPKILILTLYCGENEMSQCIRALKEQTYGNWDQEIFSHMPNLEAHEALYKKIMNYREEFDLFLKIDADMVLNKKDALAEVVECFIREPHMDHAVFAVKDWYSQRDIMGLHAYTNRVDWRPTNEKLFVDSNPEIEGYRKLFWNSPAPLADHSPDPSLEEAFLFGLHRALKVVQGDRCIKNISQIRIQFEILKAVWQEFLNSNDLRRGAVLLGAENAFSGKTKVIENKSDRIKTEETIRQIREMGTDGIKKKYRANWTQGSTNESIRKWRRLKIPAMVNKFIFQTGRAKDILKNKLKVKPNSEN